MAYEENQISDQIDAGLAKQEEMYNEVMKTKIPKEQWEKCDCGDYGYYVDTGINEYIDENGYIQQETYPIQVQCEFCYTNSKSVFNQEQLLNETVS